MGRPHYRLSRTVSLLAVTTGAVAATLVATETPAAAALPVGPPALSGGVNGQVYATVVVGDTVYDIAMARAAGAAAIGVTWGYHPVAELHAAGAHEVIKEFSSLLPALDRLYSGRAYETATSI